MIPLRGYYRCSSSKGCSARKQVERSRTDPNMLVITYTSEHNHPWPIQRNALAGSTRSSSSSNPNPSKSSTANATANSSSGSQNNTHLPSTATPPPLSASAVKDEKREDDMEFDNVEDDEDNQIAPYRPEIHQHQHQPDNFFADLEELEGDSLSMLLSQGCLGDRENKTTAASDGISDFFGWSGENNNNDERDSRSL